MKLLLPLFLFLLASCFIARTVSASALSTAQLDCMRALLSLIPTTTGTFVTDPCAFPGVTCSNASSSLLHVVQISLPSSGMTGQLPDSIGALSSLTHLDLSGNSLTGTLPASMAALTSLTSLNLGANKLDRSFRMTSPPYLFLCNPPQPFFSLCLYRHTSPSSNSFSGPFPHFIGNMQNLTYLNLNRNSFAGELPPSWAQLTLLQELHVSYTGITRLPPFIHMLQSLVIISSFKSRLSGAIPPSITSLPHLSWLLLMENQLHGSLPPDIGNLASLTELVVLQNKLSGSIPDSIGNLTNLVALTLYGNAFTGSIPHTIGHILPNPSTHSPGLLFLSLNQNQLSGSIPPNLGRLPLVILYLNENSLTGAIPPDLCQLFNGPAFTMSPNALWLNQNKLSAALPPCFGQMPYEQHPSFTMFL